VPTLAATVLRARARGEWTDIRGGNYLDGGAPWYRTYTCSDGRYIAVGALEGHFYANFIGGLGLDTEHLPGQWDQGRWGELTGIIADRVATRSRDEWEAVFTTIDACVAPVLSFSEAPSHPHVAARQAFVHSDGSWQPGVAPKFSRTKAAVPAPAPGRGADTRQVLVELGLSSDAIEELLANGAGWDGSAAGAPS
jgi:alpha-methylacyl-CoA racemase